MASSAWISTAWPAVAGWSVRRAVPQTRSRAKKGILSAGIVTVNVCVRPLTARPAASTGAALMVTGASTTSAESPAASESPANCSTAVTATGKRLTSFTWTSAAVTWSRMASCAFCPSVKLKLSAVCSTVSNLKRSGAVSR